MRSQLQTLGRALYVVTRQIRYVDIQERDDFDDLLHGLPRYAQTTLAVDVGAEVDVLSTAAEFEDLYAAAQENAVRIELATDDPVRQEFARIYGMKRLPPAIADTIEVELSSNPSADAPTIRLEKNLADNLDVTEEFSIGGRIDSGARASQASLSIFDSDASFSFVTAKPPDVASSRKRKPRRASIATRPDTVSKSLGSSSIVVSAVAVAVAIGVLLVSLLAPSASIVVVPESRAIQAEVTYGLSGSAAGLDVVAVPTTISKTIVFESSIPASGERLVPDLPARGMIFLTNPFSEIIEMQAGTVLPSADGETSFVTLEAIEIPAADPFVSARFGTAAVGIEAIEPGPSGNLGVGELSGTLASGIMFQNRFPLEGGAFKSVAVVTEDDIEALEAGAVRELQSQTGSALDGQIPEGWALVNTPRIIDQISTELSAGVGTAADSVSIRAQAVVSADVYDPSALESEARSQLLGTLGSAVPQGFGLIVDSVRLSRPQALAGEANIAYSLSAEGTAEAQFDPALVDQLSSDLVGKSEGSAVEALQRIEGVEEFTVHYGPDWLPWNPVPRFGNRISVEIHGT